MLETKERKLLQAFVLFILSKVIFYIALQQHLLSFIVRINMRNAL